MKRTLWLLLLLPAVIAAVWASQVGRPDADRRFMAYYLIHSGNPGLTAGQLFPIPATGAPSSEHPTVHDLLTLKGVTLPPDITLDVFNMTEPASSPHRSPSLTLSNSFEPSKDLGSVTHITLRGTAAHHHRFHQYLQHTLPFGSSRHPYLERSWVETSVSLQMLRKIGGHTVGLEDFHLLSASDTSEELWVQTWTRLHLFTSPSFNARATFPETRSLHWRGRCLDYYGPAWPLVFLVGSLPAIFIYVFRRPLGRMLRLPTARPPR